MKVRRFSMLSLIIVVTLLMPGGARPGSLTNADVQDVELVGHVGGVILAVAVQGKYAYTGVGPRLVILDISNPASPTVVGKTPPLPDLVESVAVVGGIAYLANDDGGLRVVDVSTPANPTEVGFYDTPGSAHDVAVADGYAYVAAGDGGLRVVDISTPANPTGVGFHEALADAASVAVADGYAYVAAGAAGLRVVDISTPANPTEVGFYGTPGSANDVAVADGYVYVADWDAGLRVVDVSAPAGPTEVGFYEMPGFAKDVAVAGGNAYVTAYENLRGGTLRVVDVSRPTRPTEVGFCDTPGWAEGVAITGRYAYITDGDGGLRVVNVSTPADPREEGSYDTLAGAMDVDIAGSTAYVTDYHAGLRIVDISALANPTEVGSCSTPDYALGVTVTGGYAYVAAAFSGLRVVDVSRPANPTEVGFYDTPGAAYDVAVAGGYAYVADGDGGLRVVDISRPTDPREVGFYDTPGHALDVELSGSYAYVADGAAGLRIVDVSTPSNPVEVGFWDMHAVGHVAIEGPIAYVDGASPLQPGRVDAGEALWVMDISTPSNPAVMGCHDRAPFGIDGVAVSGGTAYVAADGLRVVDVSTPATPTEVGFYDTLGVTTDVAVSGGLVYVADAYGGLFVLRHSGAKPTLRPTPIPEPGEVEGQIAYIGEDGNLWLMNADATNQTQLTHILEGRVVGYDWSPEGRFLALVQTRRDDLSKQPTDIHLIDLERSEQTLVLSNAEYWDYGALAWSPSGERLAFIAADEGGFDTIVQVLEVKTGTLVGVYRQRCDGVGAGCPPRVNAVNWPPNEEYLAVDMYACEAILLSLAETPTVRLRSSDLSARWMMNPAFAPTSQLIAWIEWAPQGEEDGDEAVVITDVTGRIRTRVRVHTCIDLGPNVMLSWAPDGRHLAISGEEGLCVTHIETEETNALVSGQGTWNPSWSADGKTVLFNYVTWLEPWGFEETTIGVARADGSGFVNLSVQGRMPSWRPSLYRPGVTGFLAQKQAVLARLEESSVDIVGLSFPVEAFDETAARALVERVKSEAESDSLPADSTEAFARVTLQEEALAGLLPLYSQTSADLTEAGADAFGVLLSLDRGADHALQACYTSGSPLSAACLSLRRMIERQVFRIINSLVRVAIRTIPDPEQREDLRQFWTLLADGISLEFDLKLDTGEALEDILLSTVVKGPAVSYLVREYVEAVQPSLDQGVRSADPTYAGSGSTWVAEGQLERAELHMEGIVEQAAIQAEYAHSTHQDIMRGADVAQLLTDIADIARLSPWAALAQIAGIATRVEHFLVDVSAVAVNTNSMSCTRYLSTRAGSLAFNPDQLGESCRDVGASLPASPRMARLSGHGADATAWQTAWARVADDTEAYEDAVRDLLAALDRGDAQAVTEAVSSLDDADRALDTSTAQAVSVILGSDVSDSRAIETLSQGNRFSLDALQFYLLVASCVTAPEDERSLVQVEQTASTVLSSLEEYSEALQAAAPSGTEQRPLSVIETVVFPKDVVVGEPFDITVAVRNVGSADATAIRVKAQAVGREAWEAGIETLSAGQVQTTTLEARATHTGTLTLLIEVAMGDSVADSRVDQVHVGFEGSRDMARPEAGCCVGLSGAIALPLIAAVLVRRRKQD
jgi:hypothetical protein